nr:unnamed protein product [Callosobruchus analis]
MKESESVYLKFRKLKKKVDVDIREEKIKLYHSIITKSSNKQKATWNLVNSVKGTHKNTAIRELVYENITITHSADIANAFGRHVSTIIEKKLSSNFSALSESCTTDNNCTYSMFFVSVTTEDVIHVIANIPNKKSTGPDEIPASLVKQNSDIFAPVLADFINKSVTAGEFPAELKLASLIMVFKKGDKCNADNYRPIALLSIFSKIIEKVVARKIENYLSKFNLITGVQHGFRTGYSTESSILECVQFISDNLDKGNCVVSILFDLTRAFDCVSSTFVADKLRALAYVDV